MRCVIYVCAVVCCDAHVHGHALVQVVYCLYSRELDALGLYVLPPIYLFTVKAAYLEVSCRTAHVTV